MGKDERVSTWRCGRRRADGNRCRRELVNVTPVDDGALRIEVPIRAGVFEIFSDQEGRATWFGPGDLWYLDCHPRCGAHYTFTDAHVRELARRGGDLYLADAVQAFQTTPILAGSNR
jgi:hypothetical protein